MAFLGFELFGLPYVLGDQDRRLVLATYLYKFSTLLGRPAYQLMAVVMIFIMLVTLPLVMLQRRCCARHSAIDHRRQGDAVACRAAWAVEMGGAGRCSGLALRGRAAAAVGRGAAVLCHHLGSAGVDP